METTTALVRPEPLFSVVERVALVGFLAGYRGLTREPMPSTCGSSPAGAPSATLPSSPSPGSRSRCSPEPVKAPAGRGPPSPVACAPSPASIATPKKRA